MSRFSKTRMVAQREYIENLRTKTFWIGILSLPVILVLSVLVPTWLSEVKDVRRYAVIDNSGWLHAAIQERSAYASTARFFHFLAERGRAGGAALEKLPESMRLIATMLAAMDPTEIDAYARHSVALGKSMLEASPDGKTPALSAEMKEQAAEAADLLSTLTPEELRNLGADIDEEDYELVVIPAGTADPEAWIRDQLAADPPQLFAALVIGADPVASDEGCRYISNNRTDTSLREWFSKLASEEVRDRRTREAKLDSKIVHHVFKPVRFEDKQVSSAGVETKVESVDIARQWTPVAFVYLLWIAVITIAQMLLTNTVEEKSNRIIEVLLSSVSPLELMSGKIIGIAATGLTVVLSWVVSFLIVLRFMPHLMGKGEMSFDLSIVVRDPIFLTSFVGYFLLGYLFYAAILVGFGSVTSSLKEAQNLMQPVFILLIVPLFAMIPVGQDPNGPLARALSYFPPFTPFVMMNRAAGPPPIYEYVLTTLLMIVSIAIAFWMAAKVFRIGILMTGKPPRLMEVLRWIRTPAGVVPDTQTAAVDADAAAPEPKV